ncbi:hypothetical protein O6H91_02G003500 [Diphasiastrum complanatum]|uniref:Uncharacterized protein n=1 Tax=Diphasiastrum complanatum TaxID=34168 RepID=A0ACC2ECM8_DIPCM|nr:hypothetical protein O6H91_02G003500 [Diphasiastrum complanatum]
MAYVDHTFSITDDGPMDSYVIGNRPPIKEIALTGAFLVLGSLGVIVGIIMIHNRVGGDKAHGIAFTVLGSLLILPVPYYARNAYYAYKDYKGFSLANSSAND